MALEQGYYAAHFYSRSSFQVPGLFGGSERLTSSLEIQVTTRIQNEVRGVLHTWYERRRQRPGSWLQRKIMMLNGRYYHSFCLDAYELEAAKEVSRRAVSEVTDCPHCLGAINPGELWQWRLNDGEFNAYYLGHVLHYIEGKIVAARHP